MSDLEREGRNLLARIENRVAKHDWVLSGDDEKAIHYFRAALAAMQQPACADAELREAATKLSHFAWACVSTDCDESHKYLQSLIDNLRAALLAPYPSELIDQTGYVYEPEERALESGHGDCVCDHCLEQMRVKRERATTQHPVHADVKRLLREARSYVEQAGLRHHDVSGLLAEIDAVLLVSNRNGVERLREAAIDLHDNVRLWIEYGDSGRLQVPSTVEDAMCKVRTALDIPTINEGEAAFERECFEEAAKRIRQDRSRSNQVSDAD